MEHAITISVRQIEIASIASDRQYHLIHDRDGITVTNHMPSCQTFPFIENINDMQLHSGGKVVIRK